VGVKVAARLPAEAHVDVGNRGVNKVRGVLLKIVLRLGGGDDDDDDVLNESGRGSRTTFERGERDLRST
jgi:hypothetical protein